MTSCMRTQRLKHPPIEAMYGTIYALLMNKNWRLWMKCSLLEQESTRKLMKCSPIVICRMSSSCIEGDLLVHRFHSDISRCEVF